jgi:hypothetical protein
MATNKREAEPAAIIDAAAEEATLRTLCPDLEQWPQRWCTEPADLPVGEAILEVLTPFLRHLIAQGLAPRTLKRHRDHLWLLGGEIIRRRYDDSELQQHPLTYAFAELIDDETGPLIWPRISEAEQNAFDATCRKLHRFLSSQPNHADSG